MLVLLCVVGLDSHHPVGSPSAGPPSAGPPSAGPPTSSFFFFPLPPPFSCLFFSLSGVLGTDVQEFRDRSTAAGPGDGQESKRA